MDCKTGILNLSYDITFQDVSIIVKKHESKSFFYKSLRRIDYGFIYITSGNGVYSDSENGEIRIAEGSLLILEQNSTYDIRADGENFSYGWERRKEGFAFFPTATKIGSPNQRKQ